MRAFWILIAVLVAGSAWLLIPGTDNADEQPNATPESTAAKAPVAPPMDAIPTPDPVATADPIATTSITAPTDTTEAEAQLEAVEEAPTVIADAEPIDLAPAETEPADEPQQLADTIVEIQTDQATEPSDELASELASEDQTAAAADQPASHSVDHQPQLDLASVVPGSDTAAEDAPTSETELDGSGTKADPFVVPWTSFLAARETYNPQEGKKDMPELMQKLNGKHVAIDGYVLFPLASETPSELLVMFNQWDGCCIGVPPSPYDAIEVSLAQPVQGAMRFAASGRIVGTLKVDPYVVQDWLIGLYLVEGASFQPTGL